MLLGLEALKPRVFDELIKRFEREDLASGCEDHLFHVFTTNATMEMGSANAVDSTFVGSSSEKSFVAILSASYPRSNAGYSANPMPLGITRNSASRHNWPIVLLNLSFMQSQVRYERDIEFLFYHSQEPFMAGCFLKGITALRVSVGWMRERACVDDRPLHPLRHILFLYQT